MGQVEHGRGQDVENDPKQYRVIRHFGSEPVGDEAQNGSETGEREEKGAGRRVIHSQLRVTHAERMNKTLKNGEEEAGERLDQ